MKRDKMSLLAGAVALILAVGSTQPTPPADVPCGAVGYNPVLRTETVLFWNCSREEKEIALTNLFLMAVGDAFVEVELRAPRTLEEFLGSLPVRLEDIRNPYQGRPARFETIPGYATFAGWSEEQKRHRLGDYLVYWNARAQGLCVQAVTERTVFGKKTLTLAGPCIAMPKDADKIREISREHDARFGGMDKDEKTVYAACRYLDGFTGDITASYYPLQKIPDDFAERARYHPLIARLVNPYAGRSMTEVSAPSPGDFEVVRRFNRGRGYSVVDNVLCYNRDAKLVQPQRWLYGLLTESERLRREQGAIEFIEVP